MRRHTDAFKQVLVERSLVPGASVAAIAQDAGVNANLLFNWRRLHPQAASSATAEEPRGPVLLPVTVVEPVHVSAPLPSAAPTLAPAARPPAGIIEIKKSPERQVKSLEAWLSMGIFFRSSRKGSGGRSRSNSLY